MKLKAHAKINLTLGIKGLRPDGYHEVEMVMQSVELHDCLEFSTIPEGIEIITDSPDIPPGSDNLVHRAAALLMEYTGHPGGVRIALKKNIPVAAGLAGGSTDAAAALKGLNEIWELKLTKAELFRLGEKLGADVPFCLLGGTALARGKGEALIPLPSPKALGVLLVKPPFGVSTAGAYRKYDELPPGPQPDTDGMLGALRTGDWDSLCAGLCNVLERATAAMHPEVPEIKKLLLESGAGGALMSGSGPTVFGLFADFPGAREAASGLELPGCGILVTRTI